MSLLHSTLSVSSYHTTPRARTLINITKIVNAIIMSEKEEDEEGTCISHTIRTRRGVNNRS